MKTLFSKHNPLQSGSGLKVEAQKSKQERGLQIHK